MAAAVFAAVAPLEMIRRREYYETVFVGIIIFFL